MGPYRMRLLIQRCTSAFQVSAAPAPVEAARCYLDHPNPFLMGGLLIQHCTSAFQVIAAPAPVAAGWCCVDHPNPFLMGGRSWTNSFSHRLCEIAWNQMVCYCQVAFLHDAMTAFQARGWCCLHWVGDILPPPCYNLGVLLRLMEEVPVLLIGGQISTILSGHTLTPLERFLRVLGETRQHQMVS